MCSLAAISRPSADTRMACDTPATSRANLETSQSRDSRCPERARSLFVCLPALPCVRATRVYAAEVIADGAAHHVGVAVRNSVGAVSHSAPISASPSCGAVRCCRCHCGPLRAMRPPRREQVARRVRAPAARIRCAARRALPLQRRPPTSPGPTPSAKSRSVLLASSMGSSSATRTTSSDRSRHRTRRSGVGGGRAACRCGGLGGCGVRRHGRWARCVVLAGHLLTGCEERRRVRRGRVWAVLLRRNGRLIGRLRGRMGGHRIGGPLVVRPLRLGTARASAGTDGMSDIPLAPGLRCGRSETVISACPLRYSG